MMIGKLITICFIIFCGALNAAAILDLSGSNGEANYAALTSGNAWTGAVQTVDLGNQAARQILANLLAEESRTTAETTPAPTINTASQTDPNEDRIMGAEEMQARNRAQEEEVWERNAEKQSAFRKHKLSAGPNPGILHRIS